MVISGIMSLNDQFTAVIIHSITQIQSPPLFIGAGLFLFLVSLLLYAIAGRGSTMPTSFTFQGERGPISISLRAIEDYITKNLEEQQLANGLKTKVGISKDRKKLVVRASVSAWSEQNLKQLGDVFQREIEARLKEGLGLDNVDRVIVSVDKIGKNRFSRAASTRPPGQSFS